MSRLTPSECRAFAAVALHDAGKYRRNATTHRAYRQLWLSFAREAVAAARSYRTASRFGLNPLLKKGTTT